MFTTSTSGFRTVVGAFGTVICAGVCLLGATAPAQAADAPRTKIVSYSDLNLAHGEGRKQFDARINFAAHEVCATGSNDLVSVSKERACVRAALDAAQAQKVAAVGDYKG